MRMIGAARFAEPTVVGRDDVAGHHHLDPNVEHDPNIETCSEKIATLGIGDARPILVAACGLYKRVCTENLIRVADATETPKLAG
jgi:hypothetical protein